MSDGYQNYILYRTAALMYQPASYTDRDGKTITPASTTSQPVGYVVGTQILSGLSGITVPSGFAYALDANKKYTPGSVYIASTNYTASCSSSVSLNSSLTIGITPNNDGPTEDVVVILSDGNAGGLFSSTTVTIAGCTNATQTVTYTPKAAGSVTITCANNGGLTNPANISITVDAS